MNTWSMEICGNVYLVIVFYDEISLSDLLIRNNPKRTGIVSKYERYSSNI